MCLDCFCFRGSDSEGWKEFISKPSLPYVLRMLTGLCSGHDSTQVFFLLLYLLYHYPFGCKIYFPIFIGIGYKNFSLLVPYSCAFSPQSWNNLLCKPFFFTCHTSHNLPSFGSILLLFRPIRTIPRGIHQIPLSLAVAE